MKVRHVLLAALLAVAAPLANAEILFFDDFEDGDISNWSVILDGSGPDVAVDKGIEASTLDSVSGARSLRTYFVSDRGTSADDCNAPCRVLASIDFTVVNPGDYVLDLFARSRDCSGCVISYDILSDGTLLSRANALSFEQRTFALNGLTAGTHTLRLGMHTTVAFSGAFQAFFDDVCVSSGGLSECRAVPEPGPMGILLLGLVAAGGIRSFRRRELRD